MALIERKFTLAVPSSTENLAMIRDFVASVGHMAGLGPKDLGQVELAVDEACANVIEHAHGKDSSKEVTIRAIYDDAEVRISVVDTGDAWDPGAIEPKELQQLVSARKSGGLGMRIIKSVMDEVQYHIIPGEKNELLMVKKLKKS